MIVGLHGKMGAGKNEAARRLKTIVSTPVIEVSYAASLKRSVAALLDCGLDDLERWKNEPNVKVLVIGARDGKRHSQTVRSFLQRYGTEAHRGVFGDDFWLDVALPRDRDYSDALYVVTDVRFPNEKQRIEDLGGYVARIVGPNENTGGHASEQTLDCPIMIDNTVRDDGFRRLDAQLGRLPISVRLAA